ncbi:hypothetical protein [Kordia jejudonensis]|uniref:hypothetical protein n=1 Tax=Kordia jejudonensis TaxID=1348245 RepID=UPI000629A9A6|nr:hypothetical protein [Kordia jejudonensis]
MKKFFFTAAALAGMFLFSCSEELKENTENVIATELLTKTQKTNWVDTKISNEIINNQKSISHYEFNVNELKELVGNENVSYVWFDLGLNDANQITFTATGESTSGYTVMQVSSKIISTNEYKEDFSVFTRVGNVALNTNPELDHILQNSDAYEYLTEMKKAYDDFEETLDQEGQRVERFGLDVIIVKRMLMTHDINSLGLFLGKNKQGKMTTVFIGKDKNDNLLIDAQAAESTAGMAFDHTLPCPQQCGCTCDDGEFSPTCKCDDDQEVIED